MDVFTEDAEGQFSITALSELLRTDSSRSMAEAVKMLTHETFWAPAGKLLTTVRTGMTPFTQIFGMPFFDYFAKDPATSALFHRGMASLSDTENGPIAACYDFSPYHRLVDVGGGYGGFLIEALHACPSLRGVLYDHAHVLQESRIDAAKLSARCEPVAGDILEAVPAGDCYVLKRILHDWSDETSIKILKNCHRSLVTGGRILVVDSVIPRDNAPHPGKWLDVLMLTSFPGRERTEAEFAQMFAAADLRLNRIIPTPTVLSIVEAVAI